MAFKGDILAGLISQCFSSIHSPNNHATNTLVNISSLMCALSMGWTSPMIPVLTSSGPENPSETPLTINEISWISSSIAIGGLLSPFVGGYLADRVGRKQILLANASLFLLGYLILATQFSVAMLLVSRICQGFAIGISITVQAMYVGEISTEATRGALGSLMNLFMSLGFLIVNVLGPLLTYRMFQVVLLIFPCTFILAFSLMPESPHYLVAMNRKTEAVKALAFLRHAKHKQLLDRELEEIEIQGNAAERSSIREIFKRSNLKALWIAGTLIACQQMAGINGVFFYAVSIFQDSGMSIKPSDAATILCAVQLVACTVTPFLASKWGRRPLLLISSFFVALFLIAFAGYRYAEKHLEIPPSFTWTPIMFLVGYLIAFSWGLAAIPWAIISEIFPPNIKGVAAPIMTCIAWTSTFLVTQLFQPLTAALGAHWVFGMFAVSAIFCFFFTLTVVFETQGLSLIEVQQKLQ